MRGQVILTVILAAAAGLVGAWFGAHGLPVEEPPSMSLRMAVDELAKRGLVGLSADQKQRISEIESRYYRRRSLLRTQIAAANIEIADALHEDMSMGPKVEQSIDHLKNVVGDLQHDTIAYILELRATLTPQQQVAFDDKVMTALITPPR